MSSCPGRTKNLVEARRTASYSSIEIEIGSLHSSRLHSQRNSERSSTWNVWLTSAIRSLTSRKSDSLRPCRSARVVMTPFVKKVRLTRLRSMFRRHNPPVDADRSFERIYRRHRREVYGSVLRDVRDPDEAEDVTQAAFLNAFRAMRRGDTPEKPRAWLLTIARNVVRRRARLRAERPQEVELDSELLLTLDDDDGSASADIRAALLRLTDAQREAILLREIQGRSYAEIAFELGLSLAAVEALIFRARRALAEELELVDRVPIVRPRRRDGFLGLPGLAKAASFGFSFGRVGFAGLVGCAVLGTVPVGDSSATDVPAAVAKARM